MKGTIKAIIINILIFLSYFLFSYFIQFLINIFNVDIYSWKFFYRIIFIYSIDITPLLILMFIYRKKLKSEFEVFKSNYKNYFDKYFKYWILGIGLMAISNILISIITKDSVGNNEQLVRETIKILPVYSIITACVCAPIAEELAYRKAIKNIFRKKWLSIIMSGLIFGLAHVIGTYDNIKDLLYVIPYGILGSVFMYIYYDSDNIYTTISLHFIHNTLLLTIYIISLKI